MDGRKRLRANICRLVFSASIYKIWRNWNETKHGSQPKTEEQMLEKISWEIQTRILGKVKFKKEFRK